MKLSSVVNRINGNVDRFTTDLMYYIGGEHFESNELAITKKGLLKENLNILGFKFHFAFQERDVIFMARNPHLRKAGMVMFSGLCSDASYILRSKDENVLTQEFLAVQLQSDHFWDYCESHKVGSVNFANNWSSIANYEFDLPPIEVQRKIGEKVWAAYRVKESYKKLLAATDDMLKAKFQEMFGEEEREQLGDIATYINGSAYKPEDWSVEGLPIVRIQNLTNNDAPYNRYDGDISKKVCIKNGDILISWSATLGVFVWNQGDALLNQHIFKVRFDKKPIDIAYFIYAVTAKLEDMILKTHGSTMKHIIKSDFDATLIPYPSLDKQKEFAIIATQAEATKESLRKSIENIDQVIKSLINQ
jgi:type I restriction enzyme S subunit